MNLRKPDIAHGRLCEFRTRRKKYGTATFARPATLSLFLSFFLSLLLPRAKILKLSSTKQCRVVRKPDMPGITLLITSVFSTRYTSEHRRPFQLEPPAHISLHFLRRKSSIYFRRRLYRYQVVDKTLPQRQSPYLNGCGWGTPSQDVL